MSEEPSVIRALKDLVFRERHHTPEDSPENSKARISP